MRRAAALFWFAYFASIGAFACVWLSGCIKPTTMYGDVYECPQSLIERLEQRLDKETSK